MSFRRVRLDRVGWFGSSESNNVTSIQFGHLDGIAIDENTANSTSCEIYSVRCSNYESVGGDVSHNRKR